jgi:peptide-methionine (S)-S-oxide reductase
MAVKTAYLAGGCFWGLEELFRDLYGVVDTEVGYSGGKDTDPTYENHPGHAETLKISYDDTKTTYGQLLDFFFRVHDPTTINRQGNDIGSSYRSVIFYQNDSELKEAKHLIEATDKSGLYHGPVVTALEPFTNFYEAEEYHQDYLQKSPGGYTCHFIRTDTALLDNH